MNATGHFEEDDLALYAMRLLAEPEASAAAHYVAEHPEAQRQVAEMQAQMGVFAQAAVELQPVPERSLGRLMGQIEREKKILVMPETSGTPRLLDKAAETDQTDRGRPGRVLPWIGWAVAAAMALAAGTLYKDRGEMQQRVAAESGQAAQVTAAADDAARERDALQAKLAEQTNENDRLRAGMEIAKAGSSRDQAALTAQSAKLSQQTAKADEQVQVAAATAQERDRLQATITAQANQLSQQASDRAQAQRVLDALNDRTALRVTLTQPKSAAMPTGRATYVASRGTLVFQASNLAPLEASKVYELWILPADGSSPVPAGTFVPDARGNASIVTSQLSRAVAAKGFAVTMENEGGSQTPTMPLLLAGL